MTHIGNRGQAPTGGSRRDFIVRTAAGLCAAAVGVRAEQARSPWDIGIYTRPWANLDWRAALDAIAQAGYSFVGLMTAKAPSNLVLSTESTPEDAETVGSELKKRNLTVLSVWGGNSWFGWKDGAAAGLRRLVDHCATIGARSLLIGGTGKAEELPAYLDAIAAACDRAAERRVGLALKPHGGLNATGPQCRDLVQRVNRPEFRIWYDAGNILYYSDGRLDPVTDLKAVAGLVTGWCIKDFKAPKDVALTPGSGQVDFEGVLSGLKAGGFRGGPLVIECLTPGSPEALIEEARKARAFLAKLVG